MRPEDFRRVRLSPQTAYNYRLRRGIASLDSASFLLRSRFDLVARPQGGLEKPASRGRRTGWVNLSCLFCFPSCIVGKFSSLSNA